MTTAGATPKVGGSLTALLAVVAVLVLVTGIALLVTAGRSSAPAVQSAPVDALYAIAIDADSAVTGDEAGLHNFQNQLRQLKDDAARDTGAAYVKDSRFIRLLANGASVLQAQGSLTDANAAARDTH